MKNLNFLSVVVALVLMVTAVSCVTPLQGGYDDDYYSTERRTSDRIYVNDPYYGTIVLERDPYSGRYYQVSPYGYYSPFDTYGYGYNYPNYNRGYSDRRGSNSSSGNTRPSAPNNNSKRNFEDARKKVLGDRKQ